MFRISIGVRSGVIVRLRESIKEGEKRGGDRDGVLDVKACIGREFVDKGGGGVWESQGAVEVSIESFASSCDPRDEMAGRGL